MGEKRSENKTDINKGFGVAFISAIVLSLAAIFIRYLTRTYQLPPLVLAYWRELMVAAGLGLIFLVRNPNRLGGIKPHIFFLIPYGLILALFNALWTLSVALNGAAVATVLAYSSAGFTVLLGWLILKEELTTMKLIVVMLSTMGCALIVDAFDASVWKLNTVGIAAGVSSGFFYAFYSIYGRKAAQRGLNTWTVLFYIFAFASAFMLAFNLLSGGRIPGAAVQASDLLWLGNDWAGWAILALLALGPTLVGYGLYNISLEYLPSSVVNLVVTIEPVFTALIAYFVFGEVLSGTQLLGGALIMGAVLVLRTGKW